VIETGSISGGRSRAASKQQKVAHAAPAGEGPGKKGRVASRRVCIYLIFRVSARKHSSFVILAIPPLSDILPRPGSAAGLFASEYSPAEWESHFDEYGR